MEQPANIAVSGLSDFHSCAAASWEMDGARFHVWFNVETRELDADNRVYKNPPHGVDHKHQDYYRTRYLRADHPKNEEIIRHVMAEIDRLGLIAVARSAQAEEERQRQAANKEAQRIERLKEAGPQLADALKAIRLQFFGSAVGGGLPLVNGVRACTHGLSEEIKKADALLKKLEAQ